MDGHAFTLAGAALVARGSGALWWPAMRLLAVADLHLGKSLRLARRGGPLLPPYETTATLDRLAAEIAATDPVRVICLGDSFDDAAAARDLDPAAHARLRDMADGRDWVWIAGNHDPALVPETGIVQADCNHGPLTFRHIADTAATAEVSGHYHPKWRIGGRSRSCFLIGNGRVILPAYGTFTGGLWSDDPAFAPLCGVAPLAVLTGTQPLPVPVVAMPPQRPLARRLR